MEYKFRAVDLSGNYIIDIGSIEFFVDGQIIVNGEIPVRHLLQYTGLKDKNGVEIYADGVVKYPYKRRGKLCECTTYVIWNNGWVLKHNESKIIDSKAIPAMRSMIEVIGNIHQNPELLNAK